MINIRLILSYAFILLSITLSAQIKGGRITLTNGDTTAIVCLTSTDAKVFDVILRENEGENSAWVVTDTFGIVIDLPDFPPLDLDDYTPEAIKVFHLSYDQISDLAIGAHKDAISGFYAYSNPICIGQKRVFPGTMSLVSGDTLISCSGDGLEDILIVNTEGNNGSFNAYAITDIEDKILAIVTSDTINTDNFGSGRCFIQQITYEIGVHGFEVDSSLFAIDGCYELSNKIALTKTVVNGGELFLDGGRTEITLCVGDGVADAFSPTLIDEEGNNHKWIIVDTSGIMLALVNNGTFNLEGVGIGISLIYHIMYENIENLVRNQHIDSLSGCFDLSNPITVYRVSGHTEPGVLTSSTTNTFCNGDKQADITEVAISGNLGELYLQLIVDQSGTILDTFSGTTFNFEGFSKVNTVFVFGLSYVNGIGRLAIGNNIEDLEGCYSLSNSISISLENTSGGNIQFSDGSQSTVICSGDGADDLHTVSISDTCGLYYKWIITDKKDSILSIQELSIVNLETGFVDSTFLQLVAYNNVILGLEEGEKLTDVSGCFSISNQLQILNSFGEVDGGILTAQGDLSRCILPSVQDTFYFTTTDIIGDSSFYILIQNEEIVFISDTNYIVASDLSNGGYDLYHVSAQKFTTGFGIDSSLNQIKGCYDLSNAISINVNRVLGGTISADPSNSEAICIGDVGSDFIKVMKSGIIADNSYIVITDISGVIVDVFLSTNIGVNGTFPNSFKVWNISFNGTITGLTKGKSIFDIIGCYDLSNSLEYAINKVAPFNLKFADDSDTLVFCLASDSPIIKLNSVNGIGNDTLYVVTDDAGKVMASQDSSTINLTLFTEEVLKIYVVTAADSIVIDSVGNVLNTNCWTKSNTLTIINRSPNGGVITFDNGMDVLDHCMFPGSNDSISVVVTDFYGENTAFILTEESGEIIEISNSDKFDASQYEIDTINIYHVAYYENVTLENGNFIDDLEGCIAKSTPIQLRINRLDGGLLTFDNESTDLVICLGEGVTNIDVENNLGKYSYFGLLNKDSLLLKIDSTTSQLGLDTLQVGAYFIVHLSSIDTLTSTAILGQKINVIASCYHASNLLSLTIQDYIDNLDAITLDSLVSICDNGLLKTVNLTTTDTSELIKYIIVTNAAGVIISVVDTTSFTLDNESDYSIFQIGFNSVPDGFAVGINLNSLEGCFGLSDTITIEAVQFDGGDISIFGENEITLCGVGITVDSLYPSLESDGSPNGLWIVTDKDDKVIDVFNSLPILVDNNGPTVCYIRHVAYLEGLVIPQVDSAYSTIAGCYEESNKITVTKALIRGGTVLVNGSKELSICSGDQSIDEVNISITGVNGPNSAWILSDTLGKIISILATPPNNFNGLPSGSCLLRHIRYSSGMLEGLDIGALITDLSGCFQTSDSLRINKMTVNGGKLTVQDSLRELTVCVDDGIDENITPVLVGDIGAEKQWVVTTAIGEIIEIGSQPPFNFEGEVAGQSFIWNVSFIGVETGLEIGQFISDLEGCAAVSNPIRIRKNTGADCVVGTNDYVDMTDFSVAPNPTTGKLQIENFEKQKARFSVFNAYGKSLQTSTIDANESWTIDLQDYASGIYFVKILTERGQYSYTVIKI